MSLLLKVTLFLCLTCSELKALREIIVMKTRGGLEVVCQSVGRQCPLQSDKRVHDWIMLAGVIYRMAC